MLAILTMDAARQDAMAWQRPVAAPADILETPVQSLQEDLQAVMHLQRVSPELQLSVYPPHGTQYVRHRDAFPDDGSEAGVRRVRARLSGCIAPWGLLQLGTNAAPALVTQHEVQSISS